MPHVNHEILVWARETANLTREDAVKKLGIKGVAAVHRLTALETGEAEPTRPMLVKMTKQYRRPLLTFYLFAPPRQGTRGADFRALPGKNPVAANALLDALLRDVRARQSMVRAVMEDEDEVERLPFIGARTMLAGKAVLLESLQALLGVDRSHYRAQPDADAAFTLLRTRAETAGVFVLLKGDLGSHHTAIDVEVFRGFALADDVAPFVVINDRDAKPAFSFTLLHELVHLILGQTGISGARAETALERFCNDVAGDFLLPAGELEDLELHDETDLDMAAEGIGNFARARRLSNGMVAYAAFRAGVISQGTFDNLASRFRQQWVQGGAKRRRTKGGPNYYVVRRHRIGNALIGFTQRMMGGGSLTTSKAAKILGVKPQNVQALFDTGGPA